MNAPRAHNEVVADQFEELAAKARAEAALYQRVADKYRAQDEAPDRQPSTSPDLAADCAAPKS